MIGLRGIHGRFYQDQSGLNYLPQDLNTVERVRRGIKRTELAVKMTGDSRPAQPYYPS